MSRSGCLRGRTGGPPFSQMKLYALYTPSHEALAKEWFLPSLLDDYDLHVARQPQDGAGDDHRYGTPAFNRTTLAKVELIIQAIRDNWDDVFLFSDVDIQFFQSVRGALDKAILGRDVAFQQNQLNGEINSGFFVCRANVRTQRLWERVREVMQRNPAWNDQDALNHVMLQQVPAGLRDRLLSPVTQRRLAAAAMRGLAMHRVAHVLNLFPNEFGVQWRYLPIEFFTTGMTRGTDWEPGQDLRLPRRIAMHHANFCVGVEAKAQQLREVRQTVVRRQAG